MNLDVLIIGAGFSGLYAIHKFRQLGLRVLAVEKGDGIGGTWHWNRYPGCRCDVSSVEYSYSFSSELQQEWTWTELMSSQPELLSYINHVADRFQLRRNIRLKTRVEQLAYDEETCHWTTVTEGGQTFCSRFVVMATGCLSMPNTPSFHGMEDFTGKVYHTGFWPHEGVDFSGLHVGVIGTGSSGIQAIPELAKQARQLTVFQRTPNYTVPSGNGLLSASFTQAVKENYEELKRHGRNSFLGYVLPFGGARFGEPMANILETTAEERAALLDSRGFGATRYDVWANTMVDHRANELACEMYREQVRRVVKDPTIAEGLTPRGYPMGCKRQVIDQGYFETFNRDNVKLVDLRNGGIERITGTGVQTQQGHFALDALVFATGFDAMTGAIANVDIQGRNSEALAETWKAGPVNYLGLQVHGFPNLFTVTGPGSPSVLSNMIMSIEQHVDWIADCLAHMRTKGHRSIEPSLEAQSKWVAHVNSVAEDLAFVNPSCSSWYLGANIPGKPRIFMPYAGGV